MKSNLWIYFSFAVDNRIFKEIDPPVDIPKQETLKDLVMRTIPFWTDEITPDLQKGKSVLIVAHGTSLRGLVKHIENLDEEAVRKLNLPNGIPFVYNIDRGTLRPTGRRKYLADENVVHEAVEKVLNMGMKKWNEHQVGGRLSQNDRRNYILIELCPFFLSIAWL